MVLFAAEFRSASNMWSRASGRVETFFVSWSCQFMCPIRRNASSDPMR